MSVIENYKGVNIRFSEGYYTPEVAPGVETQSLQQMKDWVDTVWLPMYRLVSSPDGKTNWILKIPKISH
jgi:hypothetical protein